MHLRLIQCKTQNDERQLVAAEGDEAWLVGGVDRTYDLAVIAIREKVGLVEAARARQAEAIDIRAVYEEGRVLAPVDHADPAHLYMTGTGLTHLGSAEGRQKMHQAAASGDLTDSMRMFMMGLEGGKPPEGTVGVQPEWFYKGDGSSLVGSGMPLVSPAFGLDGSEEPEIAGIYIVDDEGVPRRIGFTLANEFSDHVTEQGNYLWLAHSKLRPAALGAELLVGNLPVDIRGTSRIYRAGRVAWEKPFLSGEANMSHSIANLEHHHFKHGLFRRPGDVHVHFFGTATLSFSDEFQTRDGDVFEVAAEPFALPLRNPLAKEAARDVKVCAL